MSQEIQLYQNIGDPIAAAERMGGMFAKSGLFGVEKTETGMVLALACMAERKSPFDIVRTYHIVENKLAMRSDAMLAKFRERGGKVKWKQFDDKAAVGVWTFEGVDTEIGFTMEDAKKMEVIRPRSGWTKAPDAMLRARCIAKAVRMICPEVIAGYLSVEEITDDNDGAPQKEIVLPQSSVTIAPAESTTPKRGRTAKVAEQAPIDVPSNGVAMPEPPKPNPTNEPAKPVEPPVQSTVVALTQVPTPAPVAAIIPTDGRFVAQAGKDGGINAETVAHLMGLFGEYEAAAFAWLKKKPHWFVAQKSDNLSALLPDKAQTIIDKFPAFVKQINIK